jgi:hypothetical protein
VGVGNEQNADGARLDVLIGLDAHVPMLDFFSEKQYRERLGELLLIRV